MRTVWKYPLVITDKQTFTIPIRSKILCVKEQGGVPTIWVEVDSKYPQTDELIVYIVGTGNEITFDTNYMESPDYLDSVVMKASGYVWHVYYKQY